MAKFNSALMKKVKEDQFFEKEQNALKKKHHITSKNVVVVEKANTIKFLIRTIKGTVKTVFLIAIMVLAFVGITALCYPGPRQEVSLIYARAMQELMTYLPN